MYTLADIADRLQGELNGPADLEIQGVGPYDDAQPGQIVVAFDSRALEKAEAGPAAAVVVPAGIEPRLPAVVVAKPPLARNQLLRLFAPAPPAPAGVHPTAVVHPSAQLGPDITVGPYSVIEEGVVVGARCRIGPHVVIGAQARLGDDVLLYANVTIYDHVRLGNRVVCHSGSVVGGNGFGIELDGGQLARIPQLGSTILADGVELGCNTCVDRATIGYTRLGAGTKLDNLVQVAHNCQVGENCILAGQVGIAGSSTVGDGVVMGGQAGIGDHVTVGDRAKLGAQAGVIRDVKPGEELMGTLGMPVPVFMQVQLLQQRLRELFRRVDKLEDKQYLR
jgi:UDP-3-O-[3-hydroxymyristoyl] glucosamine N-acyltransferase